MPKFISLKPAVEKAPEIEQESKPVSLPTITLKPAAPAIQSHKMRILLIASEKSLAYIIRMALRDYDVRVEFEVSGEYDLLILHRDDVAGQDIDPLKTLYVEEDIKPPYSRSRAVADVVRSYARRRGFNA